jgi:hypothetical protein
MGRSARQPVSTLVEGDEPAISEMARETLPVARIGAEAVKQKHCRRTSGSRLRPPLQVVEAGAISFEPSVGRFAHPR